ncbi:MAG: response regulator [Alphaproteobacteria bacterium]|nr:response regulator [Alphaproteobacteria bacterium]
MRNIELHTLRILIVDDSQTARKYLGRCLKDLGAAEVVVAEDGAEAIDMLRSFAADIVISDFNMAIEDGIKFTQMVRTAKDSPAPDVPIVMLTSDATRETLDSAMAAGVDGFLVKPVSADKLRHHILHTMNVVCHGQGRAAAAVPDEAVSG